MDIDLYPRRETTVVAGRVARRTVAGLAVLWFLSACNAATAQGRRVALVVGNDAYQTQSVLRNAVNDARAVAAALEQVGFAVTRVENADRAQLTSRLSDFAGSLRDDDVALFYFAGHGVQVEQENYLMPTDYVGRTAAALRFDAVSASDVQEMLRPARVAMLVFDACRNNPYRGVRGGAGLAAMEARGTLIAYAAGAGEVAADSAPGASNGLFTAKFVEALREPGLTATELFRRVRRDVYETSNAEQWPAVYDDLLSDFVVRPAAVVPAGSAGFDGAGGPAAALLQQETAFWQSIEDSTDAADFEAYLELFANGTFARLARNRLASLLGSAGAPPLGTDPPRPALRAGDGFRDCAECPEMVVLPGGWLAMGRYEVTVGEYRTFVSATGVGAENCSGNSWRGPGFPQTDRHPVACVSWDDAQAYVSWLSRRTGELYRLPSEVEWERAAGGSQAGCYRERTGRRGTCPVGSYGSSAVGLSDMVGSVWEWTSDCWNGYCGRRTVRGGSWFLSAKNLRPSAGTGTVTAERSSTVGFRVARTLD